MPVDLNVVKLRLNDIRFSIAEILRITKKDYSELSIDEKYAIRYNIIVLVESLVALCIHIAREEFNYIPKSYSDAVMFVCERLKVLCIRDLVDLVRLRNLLIHRYWSVDDKVIYENIKKNFTCVLEFTKCIEERYLGK